MSSTSPRATTQANAAEISLRKDEHVRTVVEEQVESGCGAGWADVHLLHRCLPAADVDEIDLSVEFLGRRLPTPFVIAGMTGGHPRATAINAALGAAAARHGLAIGVGSQRAALANPSLALTYRVVRDEAPDAFVIGNLGAAQLVPQNEGAALDPGDVRAAVEMLNADALAVHLNFLEETVQPEGNRRARGVRDGLRRAAQEVEVPLIAKETGCGCSRADAHELRELGVRALDVGGRGGTSFAAVEMHRARAHGDRARARLGEVFKDWGIPTAVSVVGVVEAELPLIATGGVRSGLDAAKAIALGATLVGVARPFLLAALEGTEAVDLLVAQMLEELRTAVFLSGGRRLADLRRARLVVVGETRRWLDDLGYGDFRQ